MTNNVLVPLKPVYHYLSLTEDQLNALSHGVNLARSFASLYNEFAAPDDANTDLVSIGQAERVMCDLWEQWHNCEAEDLARRVYASGRNGD